MVLNASPNRASLSTVDESWLTIFAISQQLLSCAIGGDWDKTISLSQARHEKLEDHFQRYPVSADTALVHQKNMEKFTVLERQLHESITDEQKKLTEKSRILRNQKAGINAYQIPLI